MEGLPLRKVCYISKDLLQGKKRREELTMLFGPEVFLNRPFKESLFTVLSDASLIFPCLLKTYFRQIYYLGKRFRM